MRTFAMAAALLLTVSACSSAGPDTPENGYAGWRDRDAHDPRRTLTERTTAKGNKHFVQVSPAHPGQAVGGLLHDGTFYAIMLTAPESDPGAATRSLLDVIDGAIG